jgi:hypothetical protein
VVSSILHTQEVTGSSPVAPTIEVFLNQRLGFRRIQPIEFARKAARLLAEIESSFAVGQAIVFRGLPSSSTVRRRQTTIVCPTPGTGTVQLIRGHYTRIR